MSDQKEEHLLNINNKELLIDNMLSDMISQNPFNTKTNNDNDFNNQIVNYSNTSADNQNFNQGNIINNYHELNSYNNQFCMINNSSFKENYQVNSCYYNNIEEKNYNKYENNYPEISNPFDENNNKLQNYNNNEKTSTINIPQNESNSNTMISEELKNIDELNIKEASIIKQKNKKVKKTYSRLDEPCCYTLCRFLYLAITRIQYTLIFCSDKTILDIEAQQWDLYVPLIIILAIGGFEHWSYHFYLGLIISSLQSIPPEFGIIYPNTNYLALMIFLYLILGVLVSFNSLLIQEKIGILRTLSYLGYSLIFNIFIVIMFYCIHFNFWIRAGATAICECICILSFDSYMRSFLNKKYTFKILFPAIIFYCSFGMIILNHTEIYSHYDIIFVGDGEEE